MSAQNLPDLLTGHISFSNGENSWSTSISSLLLIQNTTYYLGQQCINERIFEPLGIRSRMHKSNLMLLPDKPYEFFPLTTSSGSSFLIHPLSSFSGTTELKSIFLDHGRVLTPCAKPSTFSSTLHAPPRTIQRLSIHEISEHLRQDPSPSLHNLFFFYSSNLFNGTPFSAAFPVRYINYGQKGGARYLQPITGYTLHPTLFNNQPEVLYGYSVVALSGSSPTEVFVESASPRSYYNETDDGKLSVSFPTYTYYSHHQATESYFFSYT